MTPVQQTIAMVFGAAVAITGIVLFTLKHEESETRAKLFGIELTVKTPSIVIFALGCIIFLSPFAPFFRSDGDGDGSTDATGTTTAPATATSTTPPIDIPAVSELNASPIDTSVVLADGSVWVVVTDGGPRLLRLDPSTLQPTVSQGFSGIPLQVVAVSDSVWVLTQQGVLPFDPVLGFEPSVSVGGIPGHALPALGSLWILLPDNGVVVRFASDTNHVVARIPVGPDPEFIVLAAKKMWVASAGDSTVTPIDPNNDPLPPISLPDVPVAMISFKGAPLVAMADGRVMRIDPTGSGDPVLMAHVSSGRIRLVPTDDLIWAWQQGVDALWRIDPTGEPQQQTLPFAVEKLTELGGVLWAVAADGRVAEIDASSGSVHEPVRRIGNEPVLLAKSRFGRYLLVFARDGSVFQFRP